MESLGQIPDIDEKHPPEPNEGLEFLLGCLFFILDISLGVVEHQVGFKIGERTIVGGSAGGTIGTLAWLAENGVGMYYLYKIANH